MAGSVEIAIIAGIKEDIAANNGAAIMDHTNKLYIGFMEAAVIVKISGP